jgi:hypothetical protein
MVYFVTKKSQFGYIFEGLATKDVGIYFMDKRSILRPFDIGTLGSFDIFFLVLVYCTKKKSGNPGLSASKKNRTLQKYIFQDRQILSHKFALQTNFSMYVITSAGRNVLHMELCRIRTLTVR